MIFIKRIRLFLANLFGIKVLPSPQGKILLKAADIIEERGWTQWTRVDEKGICAYEAIRIATDYFHGENAVLPRLDVSKKFANKALDGETVVSWNDHPRTTSLEVISKLREYGRLM